MIDLKKNVPFETLIPQTTAEISYHLQSARGNKTLFSMSDMVLSVPYLSVSQCSIQVSRKLSRSLYILTVRFIFYKTFFYWIECLYSLVILMICLFFIMSGVEWTIPFRSYWNQWIPLQQEWIDHFSLIGLKASLWQDWHVIPRLAVRNMLIAEWLKIPLFFFSLEMSVLE